jgi:hypothetical protein
MHNRRIACFLLGAWFLGSLLAMWSAAHEFDALEAVLNSPPPAAAKMIAAFGQEPARALLRYSAAERQQKYFEDWELAQIALGIALAALLFFERERRALAAGAAVMLMLVAFERFKLTPELAWLGRSLEFGPATTQPAVRAQLWTLHRMYGGAEILKLLIAAILTGVLFIVRKGRRRRSTDHVD